MKFNVMTGIGKLCLLGVLALPLAPAMAQTNCTPPPAGLVDWIPAEGNTYDVVSGGVGILYSGTGYTNGVVGQAFSFDGTNGCVMFTNTAPLTNIQNNFSIEFWAYPQKGFDLLPEGETNGDGGISGQSYAIFPDWGGDAGPAGIGICVGTNGVSVMAHAGGYLPSLLSYPTDISGWVHVAVVFTNEQPTLYLDGVNVHTGVASTRSYVYPSKNLGNAYRTGFSFQDYGPYQGFLDEVSIYNRPLAAGEIQAIYAAGGYGKCFTGTPPVVVTPAVPETNNIGDNVIFGVTFVGPPLLNYQWSFNGAGIPGATNSTLELDDVQAGSGGVYSVVVTNLYGAVTNSSGVLSILQPPIILSQPVGETVNLGSPASFIVLATGPNLTYQWKFNGANINRATSSTYNIASATTASAGTYTVVVANGFGTLTSSNAVLFVNHSAGAVSASPTNGFVVTATVTNGGYGYTFIPTVQIIGGGGSNAVAVATVSNGVVTGITFLSAGVGYTSTPKVIIEPYLIPNPVLFISPATVLNYSGLLGGTNYVLQKFIGWYWTNVSPAFTNPTPNYVQQLSGVFNSGSFRLTQTPVYNQAFATATVSHGFVIAATVNKGGSGYTTNATVQIVGGGGSNAVAIADVFTNGSVTNITMLNAGAGYTSLPNVEISQPPANTVISPMATPGYNLLSTNLLPYENYQVQATIDLLNAPWQSNGMFNALGATTNLQFEPISGTTNFYRLQYIY